MPRYVRSGGLERLRVSRPRIGAPTGCPETTGRFGDPGRVDGLQPGEKTWTAQAVLLYRFEELVDIHRGHVFHRD